MGSPAPAPPAAEQQHPVLPAHKRLRALGSAALDLLSAASPPLPPEERQKQWAYKAFLIPLISVPGVWSLSIWLENLLVRCVGIAECPDKANALTEFKKAIEALTLEADPMQRAARDVATRYEWHPTLVAFLVVALGTIIACWYLIDRSLRASMSTYKRGWWQVRLAVVTIALTMLAYSFEPSWILRTEVLEPFLKVVFRAVSSTVVETAERAQRLFQVFAFVASWFVILSASAALLTRRDPKDTENEEEAMRERTGHLADQWRRLTLTLYAGAALLATAVLYQGTLYGWSAAFTTAALESPDPKTQELARALTLATYQVGVLRADSIRLKSVTDSNAKAQIGARLDTLARQIAAWAFAAEMLKQGLVRDSAELRARRSVITATAGRIRELTTAAITRGAGIVYTILLAVMYLPAALVLMERARDLSETALDEKDRRTETTRAQWRTDHGIAFSIGTQWPKLLAVTSPLLASGGVIALLQLFQGSQ